MHDTERENQLGELINLAMDCMGVAVTIIDPKVHEKRLNCLSPVLFLPQMTVCQSQNRMVLKPLGPPAGRLHPDAHRAAEMQP
jgi:hypothetical protein